MTTILTKKKDTSGAPAPGDLTNAAGGAELAVNTADKRLYTKDSGGNVVEIGTNPTILNIDNIQIDGNTISSTNANGNIVIAPNGTGDVQLDADTIRVGDSNANAKITTNGTGDLVIDTNGGTNSGNITIAQGTNGNISLTPNGTGSVVVSKLNVTGAMTFDGNVTVGNSSADTLVVNSTITSNLIFTDNTYDIGASGATRPRSLFLGTNLTVGSLTSTRVPYASTGGLLVDSANLTFDGTNLTLGGGTANGVAYLNGSKVLTTGSAMVFDGSRFSVIGSGTLEVAQFGTSTDNTPSIGIYSNGSIRAKLRASSAETALLTQGNLPLLFGINDSEQMRLTSTGLGIGTSNLITKFTVQDTERFEVGGGSGFTYNQSVNAARSATVEHRSYGLFLTFGTGAAGSQAERMRLTSSGNLGLNTTSPAALVHANLSSSGAGLIVSYATQTASQVNLGIGVLSANRPFIGTNSSSNELEIGTMANVAMRFVTNGAIRGYMSTLGSLGMGVEPGANHGNYGLFASGQGSAYTAISMGASGNGYGVIGYGIGFTGTAGEYKALQTDNLAWIRFENGQIEFWNQMSATGGTTYTGTRNALFATNGDLLIGTNSSSGKLTVVTGNGLQAGYFQSGSGTTQQAIASFANSTNSGYLSIAGVGTSSVVTTWNNGAIVQEAVPASSGHYFIGAFTNDIVFQTGGRTNRGRFTSGGFLVVGADSAAGFGSVHRIANITAQGNHILSIDGGTEYSMFAQAVNGANYSSTDCAQRIGRNTSTLRSINAGGTINASGADYAEYMTKAGDFTIAKGDVCGVNADGKLTNVFADAISFVVKSTDPSYVGGDTWGSQETIGRKAPRPPAEGATEQEKQKYASDKAEYDALVEAARQNVDRVAFAGQVPVNVMGATPGQYIIPVNDNGAIKGMAVSNPTFEQYQVAVGKVIAIESDGRAKIIVKVA